MAHKRKDTFVGSVQWWKHLKGYKKLQNRLERIAAKKRIEKDKEDKD